MRHDQKGRVVAVDPGQAEEIVGAHLDRVGIPRKDSYRRSEVAELLRGLGYDCTPATIAEFVRKGYVSDPGETLDYTAIFCLAAALEARRRWALTPCCHDLKKTGARLTVERLIADGVDPPITDVDDHTVEDLLISLVECNSHQQREALYEFLRYKLRGYEE